MNLLSSIHARVFDKRHIERITGVLDLTARNGIVPQLQEPSLHLIRILGVLVVEKNSLCGLFLTLSLRHFQKLFGELGRRQRSPVFDLRLPLLGLFTSRLLRLLTSRNLPNRYLPNRNLPDRDLASWSLPNRDLASRRFGSSLLRSLLPDRLILRNRRLFPRRSLPGRLSRCQASDVVMKLLKALLVLPGRASFGFKLDGLRFVASQPASFRSFGVQDRLTDPCRISACADTSLLFCCLLCFSFVTFHSTRPHESRASPPRQRSKKLYGPRSSQEKPGRRFLNRLHVVYGAILVTEPRPMRNGKLLEVSEAEMHFNTKCLKSS